MEMNYSIEHPLLNLGTDRKDILKYLKEKNCEKKISRLFVDALQVLYARKDVFNKQVEWYWLVASVISHMLLLQDKDEGIFTGWDFFHANFNLIPYPLSDRENIFGQLVTSTEANAIINSSLPLINDIASQLGFSPST